MGQDESFSPIELPAGPLRECINVRQRAFHSFGVRPDFPSVAMTEYGGTLVPYDLYALNGRLVALGDRQGKGRPTDLYSFVQQSVANWKGTLGVGISGNAMPPVTALRNVGIPQESGTLVGCARVASVNGVVCLAYGTASASVGVGCFVHIFKASTDETLLATTSTLTNPRVVVAGNSLWVVGVDAANDLVGQRYDTTTSTGLGAPVNLYTGTVQVNIYDAASIKSLAGFVVLIRDNTNALLIRRYNEAGVQQQAIAGPIPGTAVGNVAVEADNTANRIVIAYKPTGDALVQTYNLTTGVSVIGPTAIFGTTVAANIYLQRLTNGVAGMMLIARTTGTTNIKTAVFSENVLAVTQKNIINYTPAGRPIMGAGYVIAPMTTAAAENHLLFLADDTSAITGAAIPAAILDNGVAGPIPINENIEGGDTCTDTTTGKSYWARLAIGTDGKVAPFVTELVVGATTRRRSCQLGNGLFVAGGLGLYFDGRNCVESGYQERPSFSVVPAGTTVGALLPGASYDYVAIWTYQDALNLVSRSRVSDIKSVTLTTAQNAASMTIYSPHTLRRDSNTGAASTIEVYRTHAELLTTRAAIVSSRDFNAFPAVAGDFNLKTLVLSIDGTANQTVTFGAADNDLAEIVAAINAQTVLCTAAVVGNVFSISSDTDGALGSVLVVSGTATDPGAGNVGLFPTQVDTGTTTAVKGTVFQRCGIVSVIASNDLGTAYAFTDTMSDATLLSQVPLYTNAERGALSGILEHEGPPPFEFSATVGNRVIIGGLVDRSEVRVSKELFPGETLAFSGDAAFRARVDGDVTQVAELGSSFPVVFTADRVYVLPNTFPDDNGNNGALGPPQELDVEEGCVNANSVCATSIGVFYQSRTGKLMLLQQGTATWVGKQIQTTLAAFPNITGAVYVELDNCVVFTCQNLAGNASVNLVFDLLIHQWMKDTFSGAQVNKASADYQGRLAYIDTALVRLQSLSLTPSAFISYSIKTGSLNPFGGDGWGRMPSVTVPFQFRGNAKLRLSVSYDDGRTFSVCKTFEFTLATGWVVDQFDHAQWWPARVKGFSYVLLWEVLPDTGNTASEGLILQRYTVELDGAKPNRARLASAQKG